MYSKRNIRILLAIQCLQGMTFYTSISALYRQAAGISLFEMSVIESLSLIASLLLEVPWGIVAERIGYRRTLIVSNGVFFLSKLVFWRASSFGGFLIERLLLSAAIAGLSGVTESYIYLSCDKGESQRVFGHYAVAGHIGALFASFVFMAFIGSRYRLSALLTAITYALAAALSPLLTEVRPPKKERENVLASFGQSALLLVRTRGLLPLVLCGAVFFEVCRMTTVFYSQLQFVRAGLDDRMIGFAGILMTLAMFASARSDHLTKRLNERRFGTLLIGLSLLSFVLLALTKSALIAVLSSIALCAATALFSPLYSAMENRLIVTEDRATALSTCGLLVDGVCVALDPILGRAVDANLTLAFLLSAGLCLASAVLYCAASRA